MSDEPQPSSTTSQNRLSLCEDLPGPFQEPTTKRTEEPKEKTSAGTDKPLSSSENGSKQNALEAKPKATRARRTPAKEKTSKSEDKDNIGEKKENKVEEKAPDLSTEELKDKSQIVSPPPIQNLSNHSAHTNQQGGNSSQSNFQGNHQRQNYQNNKRRDRKNKRDRYKKEVEEDLESMIVKIDKSDANLIRIAELQRMNVEQLTQFAKNAGVEMVSGQAKSQIVFDTVKALSKSLDDVIVGEGVLEVLPDGFGFLRSPIYNYLPSVEDIYVSPAQVRRFELRKGDTLVGTIRPPREKEKYFALNKIESINAVDPIKSKERILFENLTPLYPQERLVMETSKESLSTRVLDLAAPIGKGQRAMIVAPPRSGKTIILQQIANAIAHNNPETLLMVLMVGERPEEVTDMARTIKGEVVASTFDEPPERHVQVAEMVIEKARRQVECGKDVVILLDSMTRLARAYNTVQPHSGKILSGGVDANALHKPKRFFGAARNIEHGGSLTIIASALIETGSRMDEVIFEEFKGTGNMELVLDRRLADRRIWPAIDLIRSGTRKEDLLYHPHELEKMYLFRQAIADLTPIDAMKLLLDRLKRVNSNVEFLLSLKD